MSPTSHRCYVVTGAAGFIASRLALHLAREGHTVHACDWRSEEHNV